MRSGCTQHIDFLFNSIIATAHRSVNVIFLNPLFTVVLPRFPTFNPIDPNGRCKANGINKSKRKSYELSQWDIWALNAAYDGPLPPCQYPGRVGDGFCDSGNNNIGCEYDGGDCCLPQADARDCIDPCGVRLKFYGGSNRKCGKAPESDSFCSDHYWYGPNKCDAHYCKVTDEKYLQWQCKKTCNLCDTDPSQEEMDRICNSFIPASVRAKYGNNFKPSNTKPKPPQKFFNDEIVTGKPLPFIFKEKTRRRTTQKTTKARPTTPKTTSAKTFERVISNEIENSPIITAKPKRKNRPSKKKKPSIKESPRSSSASRTGGFVVISDPDRRRKLRSYWMRAGK